MEDGQVWIDLFNLFNISHGAPEQIYSGNLLNKYGHQQARKIWPLQWAGHIYGVGSNLATDLNLLTSQVTDVSKLSTQVSKQLLFNKHPRCRYNCMVAENIHTPPTEGIGISWVVGGSTRPKL